MEYERFLKAFRKAREDKGLTQEEVAKILKRPQSYVSKCESGERRVDVIELAEFAKVYGKPLNYFVHNRA
jgi:transcriptional regulator with XRE-family HTH domain